MNQIKRLVLSMTLLASLMASLVVSPVVIAISLTNDNTIQKLLVDEANRQGIDPTLALAMAEVESNFNPRALSKAGARGVMQIMPATAENVFGISSNQLYDAKININIGISFIKKLLNRYNQRLDIALSHYNGGSAVQDRFGRLSIIPATRKYVNKVISAQQKFTYKAYQLSSVGSLKNASNMDTYTSTDTSYYTNPITKTKIKANTTRKLNPDKSVQNKFTNYQSQFPLTNKIAKSVVKPDKSYSSATFDDSLYQKVEQLRTIRLHNIMRNTQNKSANKTNISYRHARFSKSNSEQMAKEAAKPLTEKRKKVLNWEAMFN